MQNFTEVLEPSDTPISSLAVTWLLLIPLICIASSGVLWFRGGDDALTATYGTLANGSSNTTVNAVVAALLFITIGVAIFPRVKAVVELCRRHMAFVAFAAWIMFSFLWSQFPMVTVKWAPIAALNIVFAFYLRVRFSPEQQMRLFLTLGSVCLVLSLVLAVFFPRYGIDPLFAKTTWRGLYSQKNVCSTNTMFLLPAAFCVRVTKLPAKIFRVAYVCLSVLLVIMTRSATGKIALLSLFSYFIVMKLISGLRPTEKYLVLGIGAATAVATVIIAIMSLKELTLLLGKDMTLTGRTNTWQTIMLSIMKRPILGYGYGGFWRGYQGASANFILVNGGPMTSAHNGLLEIWLDLGIVGLGLIVYSLVRAIRDGLTCLRGGDSPYLRWCFPAVCLVNDCGQRCRSGVPGSERCDADILYNSVHRTGRGGSKGSLGL